MLQLNFCVS